VLALLNLTQPNSPQRTRILAGLDANAPDLYTGFDLISLLFTETLLQERLAAFSLHPLAPTAAKLAIVIEFLKGLSVDDTDQLAAAFHDGSVRKICDSVMKAGEAGEGNARSEFVECVFEAVAAIVDDHTGFTRPKSYGAPLTEAIGAVARSHIGPTESIKPGAKRLALDLHRMCRRYGQLEKCWFSIRAPSTAHMVRRGLRVAFENGAVQHAVAFMVQEQDSYLFGTKNLEPRLANLLLIATKQLTGSDAWYTPHDITTDSYDPAVEAVEAAPSVGSVAPHAATNSLATVPFEDLLRIARSSDSAHRERSEEPDTPEPSVKRTRLA
jgi:hypothetical protein